jgi:hypothetical protein
MEIQKVEDKLEKKLKGTLLDKIKGWLKGK